MANAHAGHERAAKCAAFFGHQDFYRVAVDAGLNLPPQCTARAAAAEANCSHWNSQLREERKTVLQRVSNALLHCAHKMRTCVLHADARKCGANFGIEMRRALAQQIRRPLQAFAAGRNFFRGVA